MTSIRRDNVSDPERGATGSTGVMRQRAAYGGIRVSWEFGETERVGFCFPECFDHLIAFVCLIIIIV